MWKIFFLSLFLCGLLVVDTLEAKNHQELYYTERTGIVSTSALGTGICRVDPNTLLELPLCALDIQNTYHLGFCGTCIQFSIVCSPNNRTSSGVMRLIDTCCSSSPNDFTVNLTGYGSCEGIWKSIACPNASSLIYYFSSVGPSSTSVIITNPTLAVGLVEFQINAEWTTASKNLNYGWSLIDPKIHNGTNLLLRVTSIFGDFIIENLTIPPSPDYVQGTNQLASEIPPPPIINCSESQSNCDNSSTLFVSNKVLEFTGSTIINGDVIIGENVIIILESNSSLIIDGNFLLSSDTVLVIYYGSNSIMVQGCVNISGHLQLLVEEPQSSATSDLNIKVILSYSSCITGSFSSVSVNSSVCGEYSLEVLPSSVGFIVICEHEGTHWTLIFGIVLGVTFIAIVVIAFAIISHHKTRLKGEFAKIVKRTKNQEIP